MAIETLEFVYDYRLLELIHCINMFMCQFEP